MTDARPRETGDAVDPEHARFTSFADFADPDGNMWILQEVDHEPAVT